jgi:hypothetical protein
VRAELRVKTFICQLTLLILDNFVHARDTGRPTRHPPDEPVGDRIKGPVYPLQTAKPNAGHLSRVRVALENVGYTPVVQIDAHGCLPSVHVPRAGLLGDGWEGKIGKHGIQGI